MNQSMIIYESTTSNIAAFYLVSDDVSAFLKMAIANSTKSESSDIDSSNGSNNKPGREHSKHGTKALYHRSKGKAKTDYQSVR